MSKSREIPRVMMRDVLWRNSSRLTDAIGEMLDGDFPAIHTIPPRGTEPTDLRIRRAQISLVKKALTDISYACQYRSLTGSYLPWSEAFVMPIKNETRHTDCPMSYYPDTTTFMNLRRHTAALGRASVRMRKTRFEPGSGFLPDPNQSEFEALERPGESILFVSVGGWVEDQVIVSSQHEFRATTDIPRRLHIGDFRFVPAGTYSNPQT